MKFKATKKDQSWKFKMDEIRTSKPWAGDMARIAVRVLDYLEENGKSQRWLADQLGVTPQQVTKIVKGRQNMSWGKIKELEAVLDIKLAEIFDHDQKEPKVVIMNYTFKNSPNRPERQKPTFYDRAWQGYDTILSPQQDKALLWTYGALTKNIKAQKECN